MIVTAIFSEQFTGTLGNFLLSTQIMYHILFDSQQKCKYNVVIINKQLYYSVEKIIG
jgi:hypothetical protein